MKQNAIDLHCRGMGGEVDTTGQCCCTNENLDVSIPQTPNGRGSCVFCQKNSKSEYKTNGYIILYIQIQPLYQRLST